jgi:hypothetical protein
MPRGEVLQRLGDATVMCRAADVGGDEYLKLMAPQRRLGADTWEVGCGNERLELGSEISVLSWCGGYYLRGVFHVRATG